MPKGGPLSTLTSTQRDAIVDLYNKSSLSRDDLPYTKEFDTMHAKFCADSGLAMTQHEFWRALSSIGKMKKLKRKLR